MERGRQRAAAAERRAFESAKRGSLRARQPRGGFENEASCAGLRPEDNLEIVERAHGRANRPFLEAEHGWREASRHVDKARKQQHRESKTKRKGGDENEETDRMAQGAALGRRA